MQATISPSPWVTYIRERVPSLPQAIRQSIMRTAKSPGSLVVGGSRGLCRSVVNHDLNHARKFVLNFAI